jgi:hypothetical protein
MRPLRLPALLALVLIAPPSAGRPAEPGAGATAAGMTATSPPASGPRASPAPAGSSDLPPGSPADQALWKSAIDASNDIVIERTRAGRVQVRLKNGRYPERLSALEKRDPGSAERARDLRRRLEAAWGENYGLQTGRWPVDPTRGCGYYALTFATALPSPGTPSGEAALAQARTDVRACVDMATPALRAMRESTDRLEAIAAEIDRVLAAAGLGSPNSVPAAEAGRQPGQGQTPPPATR